MAWANEAFLVTFSNRKLTCGTRHCFHAIALVADVGAPTELEAGPHDATSWLGRPKEANADFRTILHSPQILATTEVH